MLLHLPRLLAKFRKTHRVVLFSIFIEALPRYGSALLYALLSVLIAQFTNEVVAGMAFSAFALFELFLSDPLGGALADRFGARFALKLSAMFSFVAGALLFLDPHHLWVLVVVGLGIFTAYGLRMSGTYLLRLVKTNEGGLIFGLSENLASLSYFLATVSIPFLVRADRSSWVALILMIGSGLYLFLLHFLPNDLRVTRKKRVVAWSLFNPVLTIKHGMHFIRRNSYYPLMPIANALFEGIFFSTIWFVFPLRLAQTATSLVEGLEMGIYDLVTMILAGFCGYLADRYNWRIVHATGWALIAVGVVLLPFISASFGLILAGFVIALGDNLSAYAGNHILAKHDIDHREDGSFMALTTMVRSLGYVVAPVITGYLYYEYGFSISLGFACVISAVIALWMVAHTYHLKSLPHNS